MLPFLADDSAGILEQQMVKFVMADVLHHSRKSAASEIDGIGIEGKKLDVLEKNWDYLD